jgi:hypothetical protein
MGDTNMAFFELGGYRLRPFEQCYVIERLVPGRVITRGPRKGQRSEPEWEKEIYPWDLEHGLLKLLEIVERHGTPLEAETASHALERWLGFVAYFEDAARRLEGGQKPAA